MMETTLSQVETSLAFESLPTARGLHWKDGFRGYLNTGERVAQVRLDATGAVRIRVDLDRRPAPPEALVLNASLPANLRVAGPAHRPHLLADISPDQAGFSRSLSEIRQGIRRNADGMGIGRRPPNGQRGFWMPGFNPGSPCSDGHDHGRRDAACQSQSPRGRSRETP